uniref:ADYC domain-containing protein n=1 Tax=Chamaesiphon sp. VAR_48_metabat_135_sub TaxID=2964699 RepID=UPI00286C0F97
MSLAHTDLDIVRATRRSTMNLRYSRSILFLFPLLLGGCHSLQPQPLAPKTETIAGTALKGTYITALNERGESLKFEIRDVELDSKDKEREVYLYTLFYQDPTTANWQNLCPPDRAGVAKAVVLTGKWDERGNHLKGDDRTMFACTNGVAAKCVRLEYKPWKVLNGQSLWKYHQACTRM